jgi:hypothetical protein
MSYFRHTPLFLWLACVVTGLALLLVAVVVGEPVKATHGTRTVRYDQSNVMALRSALVPVLHAQKTDRTLLPAHARALGTIAGQGARGTRDVVAKSHYGSVESAARVLEHAQGDEEQDLAVAQTVSAIEDLANAVVQRSLGLTPAPAPTASNRPAAASPSPVASTPTADAPGHRAATQEQSSQLPQAEPVAVP